MRLHPLPQPLQPGTPLEETGMESHMSEACSLIHLSTVDWIHRVPVLVFLSLNVLFLMRIMWVSEGGSERGGGVCGVSSLRKEWEDRGRDESKWSGG